MSLKDIFSEHVIIPLEYNDKYTFRFHFRNPTAEEDLQFKRRTSKATIDRKTGAVESSSSALHAPIWFFDTLCEKVTVQNGNGEPPQEAPREEWSEISPDLKAAAVLKFQNRIQEHNAETAKNS